MIVLLETTLMHMNPKQSKPFKTISQASLLQILNYSTIVILLIIAAATDSLPTTTQRTDVLAFATLVLEEATVAPTSCANIRIVTMLGQQLTPITLMDVNAAVTPDILETTVKMHLLASEVRTKSAIPHFPHQVHQLFPALILALLFQSQSIWTLSLLNSTTLRIRLMTTQVLHQCGQSLNPRILKTVCANILGQEVLWIC